MKLLNLTARYFLTLILLLLLAWCGVFYFSIQSIIYEEVDEYLTFHENEVIEEIKANPALLYEGSLHFSDFKIKKITAKEYEHFREKHPEGQFKDVKKFIAFEGEEESFRMKRSVFELNNTCYQLTSITTLMKLEDILYTILINSCIFAVLFFVLVTLLNRVILRKLWNPFYETMAKIKQYKLDKETTVVFNKTKISEFQELNQSIAALIHNNLAVYKNQKQFIENASHEMQTPVGIIQSKMELLMEDTAISRGQAVLVEEASEQIDRLTRLNKTLLLLSKIENNQFPENSQVNVTALIVKCCEYFNDLLEFKYISLNIVEQENVFLNMNADLAEILFANLIKNAINHNYASGYINVHIKATAFVISNTGQAIDFDPKLLFERFSKKSDNPQSNGLGLSIVKKICSLYNFNITYAYSSKEHTVSIIF
ncbi:MAG: sensor histidine kinase [Chitinophagaceae bacterium]|nr:sensor histidine kinase [Chitinophagaceae bacterium]